MSNPLWVLDRSRLAEVTTPWFEDAIRQSVLFDAIIDRLFQNRPDDASCVSLVVKSLTTLDVIVHHPERMVSGDYQNGALLDAELILEQLCLVAELVFDDLGRSGVQPFKKALPGPEQLGLGGC